MSDVRQFPQLQIAVEDLVGHILRANPALAVHRERLIKELAPLFALPQFVADLRLPPGITPQQEQAFLAEAQRLAQRYALHALGPMIAALVRYIVSE